MPPGIYTGGYLATRYKDVAPPPISNMTQSQAPVVTAHANSPYTVPPLPNTTSPQQPQPNTSTASPAPAAVNVNTPHFPAPPISAASTARTFQSPPQRKVVYGSDGFHSSSSDPNLQIEYGHTKPQPNQNLPPPSTTTAQPNNNNNTTTVPAMHHSNHGAGGSKPKLWIKCWQKMKVVLVSPKLWSCMFRIRYWKNESVVVGFIKRVGDRITSNMLHLNI